MAEAQDLKTLLLETNDEYRQLATKHHELDDRLHERAEWSDCAFAGLDVACVHEHGEDDQPSMLLGRQKRHRRGRQDGRDA